MAGMRNRFNEIVNQKRKEGHAVAYNSNVSSAVDRKISDIFHNGQKEAMARQARSLELLRNSSLK